MGGFQTTVHNQPAPGEAGDFYGANPRASILGAPGQFVAPASGIVVGNICWADITTGTVTQGYTATYQMAMLHRENNALITAFLGEAVYVVNPGLPLALFVQGDFWGKFAGGAAPGDKVYAHPTTGALQNSNAGGAILTPWIVCSVAAAGDIAKISTWG